MAPPPPDDNVITPDPAKPAFLAVQAGDGGGGVYSCICINYRALSRIGRLLTAKQWERAAIVYAFTRDGEHGEGRPTAQKRREPRFFL